MKNPIVFIFLLLLYNAATYGQNNIEGLGKIRIDMPEAEFVQMLADNYYGKPVILRSKKEQVAATERKTYKIAFDLVNDRTVFYFRCKQAKLYFLPSFSIGNNIEIQNVYALFFEGQLIDITVNFSEELGNDIAMKYGAPTLNVTVNSGDSPCNDGFRSREQYPFNLLSETYKEDLSSMRFDYYFRDDTIKAAASVKRFLNDKCEVKADDVIRIHRSAAFQRFVKCH